MTGSAQRYRDLYVDLTRRRALSNEALSPAQEAQSAADLDLCWNAMTDEEQAATEQWLITAAPEG
jgi:hypothetical protein